MAGFTLCWDCARATGGCPWSDILRPIKGWNATLMKKNSSRPYDTYVIHECPGFKRDAIGGGMKRYKENEHDINQKKRV